MSVTIYVEQSLIEVTIFCYFEFGIFWNSGSTYKFIYRICILILQLTFIKYWITNE